MWGEYATNEIASEHNVKMVKLKGEAKKRTLVREKRRITSAWHLAFPKID